MHPRSNGDRDDLDNLYSAFANNMTVFKIFPVVRSTIQFAESGCPAINDSAHGFIEAHHGNDDLMHETSIGFGSGQPAHIQAR